MPDGGESEDGGAPWGGVGALVPYSCIVVVVTYSSRCFFSFACMCGNIPALEYALVGVEEEVVVLLGVWVVGGSVSKIQVADGWHGADGEHRSNLHVWCREANKM